LPSRVAAVFARMGCGAVNQTLDDYNNLAIELATGRRRGFEGLRNKLCGGVHIVVVDARGSPRFSWNGLFTVWWNGSDKARRRRIFA